MLDTETGGVCTGGEIWMLARSRWIAFMLHGLTFIRFVIRFVTLFKHHLDTKDAVTRCCASSPAFGVLVRRHNPSCIPSRAFGAHLLLRLIAVHVRSYTQPKSEVSTHEIIKMG